jgi:hypothetical protein
MTTNLVPGLKIRIAVPLTTGDNTPIEKRRETRISQIVDITETGTIHETEGSVSANRMGIDWELAEDEEDAFNLAVVRLAAGPVLASIVKVEGNTVKLYADSTVPPGLLSVPAKKCGKCWDWLRGRTIGTVFPTLSEIFDPLTGSSSPPLMPGSAGPDQKPARKRGPRPRVQVVTAPTEVIPAAEPKTVSAGDRKVGFRERMHLWHAVSHVAEMLEGEQSDARICEAVGELAEVVRVFKAGGVL